MLVFAVLFPFFFFFFNILNPKSTVDRARRELTEAETESVQGSQPTGEYLSRKYFIAVLRFTAMHFFIMMIYYPLKLCAGSSPPQ